MCALGPRLINGSTKISNRLPRFTAIVSHIGGRDDFLSSPLLLLYPNLTPSINLVGGRHIL